MHQYGFTVMMDFGPYFKDVVESSRGWPMMRAEQREVALSIARYRLRQLHLNLLEASAQDAHEVLDDYARRYPDLVGSQ